MCITVLIEYVENYMKTHWNRNIQYCLIVLAIFNAKLMSLLWNKFAFWRKLLICGVGLWSFFFFPLAFFKHSLSQWRAWSLLNQVREPVFIVALIQSPWVPLPHWPDERPCSDVYSLWKWQGAGVGCWHSAPTDRKQGSKAPRCFCRV